MTIEEFMAEWHHDSPTMLVHTSGSTGKPKPMLIEKQRMEASARITCRFLGLKEGDRALLCMPLDYIAGKMMVVRALTCGLRLITLPPTGHPLASPLPQELEGEPIDFAAMVPLQVYNTLQVAEERERLRRIRHLIIGGGAINKELAEELADFPNHVWSTYGMTETLSHIALRRLNGPERSEWYKPFEGVTVTLNSEGCLTIDAPAVHDGLLVTNDLAELHSNSTDPHSPTAFRIIGRRDNVICSGGIKIQIEAVEELLRAHIHVPFMICKRSDAKFGESVALLTEGIVDDAREVSQQFLPKHWQPRYYMHTDHIPLTATGKPARQVAQQLIEKCNR